MRNNLLREVEPYRVRPADYDGPPRWETGTPQIEVLAGIAAAAEFMLSTPLAEESERETHLLAMLQEGLAEVSGVTVVGPSVTPTARRRWSSPSPATTRTPSRSSSPRAASRSGAATTTRASSSTPSACATSGGVVRAGVVRYTTREDVAALIGALVELTA